MIFLFNANGSVVSCTPEKVYQGSNNANTVYFLCPTSSENTVTVAFGLPDGTSVHEGLMSRESGVQGVTDSNGVGINAWVYQVPVAVTAKSGVVTVQFFVRNSDGEIAATASTQFTVEKGVEVVEPTIDSFGELLTAFDNLNLKFEDSQSQIDDLNSKIEEGVNQTVNVDGKLDKVYGQTPYNKLYAKDWAGNQAMIDLTEQSVAYSAMQRDGNCYVYANTPNYADKSRQNALANKGYVDSALTRKIVYQHNIRMISDKCDVITYYADGLTKALSTTVEFRNFLKNLKLMHANGWCVNPTDGKKWQVFGLTPNKREDNTEYFELHVFSADNGTALIELNDSEVTSFVDNTYTSDV